MVPKLEDDTWSPVGGFRAVLFRMVPKQEVPLLIDEDSFRAVLFRMVPTHIKSYSFFK